MDRTFHHRFTVGAKSGIVLFAAVALWLFWQKWAVAGAVMALVCVVGIERVLHSQYVFHDDRLLIDHGRFARKLDIPLADIIGWRPMQTSFGLARFLVLDVRGGGLVAVQPDNEKAFLHCLAERKAMMRKKNEKA